MDQFETLVKRLLETDGYWVRQSFKVNLTKEEKRAIGKPSMPRPEIDLLALKPGDEELIVIEVKSYLDSPGVRMDDLIKQYEAPEGRFKLFTSKTYQKAVFSRLKKDLRQLKMLPPNSKIRPCIGLVAGKVYRGREEEMNEFFKKQGLFFWGPSELKRRITEFADSQYEDDPVVLAAKVLLR